MIPYVCMCMYEYYCSCLCRCVCCCVQEFEEYELRTENATEVNGILNIKANGVIVGNISCQFDEFVTTK